MANLPLTKVQEILKGIKDKQERTKDGTSNLLCITDSNSNLCEYPEINSVEIETRTGIHSYQSQYKLYLNLVIYYILHPTIIPPLHPYQKMLKKLVPLVYDNLYSTGTFYSMIAWDKPLLSFILTNSASIEEYNKITNTLLSSLKEETLIDISRLLHGRRN